MTVAITVHNDFPTDTEVRARKIAKTLDENGYDVLILARGEKSQEVDYAKIERFSIFGESKVGNVLSSPVPINPFWFIWFCYQIWVNKVNVLIGCEIRAGPPSLLAGNLLNTGTVFDLQENNPELVKQLNKDTILSKIKRDPRIHRTLEKFCIITSDITWVVIEERKQELSKYNLSSPDIRIVRNTPLKSEIDLSEEAKEKFASEKFTLTYVGHISTYRGLDDIIDALPHVIEQTKDIQLVIGGDGDHLPNLKEKVNELGVGNHVNFVGWVPAKLVPTFIKSGDIGLIPHKVNGFTNTTIPNKLFDYMIMGKPVLSSSVRPVKRIINEENCGVVYDNSITPKKLADKITRLRDESLEEMGENGVAAVNRNYNWETESEIILESINELH